MSLSPWDLTGNISFDFTLYRPRRPSYVFATQTARQRNESYRHATKSHPGTTGDRSDFIEGLVRKKRKASYKAATQKGDEEMEEEAQGSNHVPKLSNSASATALDQHDAEGNRKSPTTSDRHRVSERSTPDKKRSYDGVSRRRYTKNLIILSLSFVLVFTAFRSIQNLQSSLNANGRLGLVSLSCLHLTMFFTCLFAPLLIDKLSSKWTMVLGMMFYLFWIAANFCPHFYTLVPTSIGVGFGQSLAWSAQVAYMRGLAGDFESASAGPMSVTPTSDSGLERSTLFRFNGVFLACFQTSHVWGNLVSSLMLTGVHTSNGKSSAAFPQEPESGSFAYCGIYDSCEEGLPYVWDLPIGVNSAPDPVLKMMGTYLVFAFAGFVLSLIILDRIPSKKLDPEKTCIQMIRHNMEQMLSQKGFCCLIPLLLFNGFEQGFIYADYNKSYISCTVGIEYIGYNMLTMGVTNFIFSFIVGALAKHIPREALVGIASILHMGLMVFLLVWIPDKNLLPVFFVISALWGVSEAIWQTQCNCLVNLCCLPDEQELAFQNLRLLQGFGASMAFVFGIFMCVPVKLYIMISLLTISVLFYVVLEYNLRRDEIFHPNTAAAASAAAAPATHAAAAAATVASASPSVADVDLLGAAALARPASAAERQ